MLKVEISCYKTISRVTSRYLALKVEISYYKVEISCYKSISRDISRYLVLYVEISRYKSISRIKSRDLVL